MKTISELTGQTLPVKTIFNAIPYNGKVFTMPSMTIPDQTLSIREILDRYARGLPLEARTPIWDENPDIDDYIEDPRRMDLSERQQLAEEAKRELDEIKQKMAAKPKKKPIIEPPISTDPPIVEQ